MEKNYTVCKLFAGYLLVILLMLVSNSASGQSPCENDELCVVQFNAGFNKANEVAWIGELNDCSKNFIDIQVDATASGKYKIVVVPTILIFMDGEEVGRFQANIMMKMEAKLDDIQTIVDEIVMESF